MTSGGKFQLGGKNITILHTFAAPFQYNLSMHGRKTGHLASREGLGRDAGQCMPRYGTVGNPRLDPLDSVARQQSELRWLGADDRPTL